MTPRCEDWRGLPSSAIEPLVTAEVRAWRDELAWDVADAWQAIEPARAAGRLPGYVTRDTSGRVTGWTCFFPHRGSLHVVALVSASAADTVALVEAILASPEAESAAGIVVSVREAAPQLRETLASRNLATATYRYLAAPIGQRSSPGGQHAPIPGASSYGDATVVLHPWRHADAEAAARLCARAYQDAADVRAFAPRGTSDEWREYVASLLTTPDCGRFLPEASFVVPGRRPAERAEIDGVVITSCLGPGTAHIAQLAVDPASRGLGWGRALVRAALDAAARRGLTRATLLVSAANDRAMAIYEAQGFTARAAFVVADARQPRRLSSAALATGGASTRR